VPSSSAPAPSGSVEVSPGARVVAVGTAVGSTTETGEVAVNALPWLLLVSVKTIELAAPAAATSSVSREIQTQSPGYQPTRRIHMRRSRGRVPVTRGSCSPQSRQ